MDFGSHLSTMVSLQPFSIPAPFVSLSNAYFMLFCYSQLVVLFLLLNVSGIWAMQAEEARANGVGDADGALDAKAANQKQSKRKRKRERNRPRHDGNTSIAVVSNSRFILKRHECRTYL